MPWPYLPPGVLFKASDVISNAAASITHYDDLKTAVLIQLQSTVTPCLQELMSKEELGDEKPSDLLRCMKKLLGDKSSAFGTDLIRHLYYQWLPLTTQHSLFSVKDKLSVEEIAQLADDFMATLPPDPSVASATVKLEADSHLPELSLQNSAPSQRPHSPTRQPSTLQATLTFLQQARQHLLCLCHFLEHPLLSPQVR